LFIGKQLHTSSTKRKYVHTSSKKRKYVLKAKVKVIDFIGIEEKRKNRRKKESKKRKKEKKKRKYILKVYPDCTHLSSKLSIL